VPNAFSRFTIENKNMNREQKYLSLLLERLPKWELRSYDHQTSLDRIRDRITSAPDLKAELDFLYKVQGFSDFALSLMWIAEKVEKDLTLDESTLAEETFVFEKLRAALGDVPSSTQDPASSSESVAPSAISELPVSSSDYELGTPLPSSFESTLPEPMFEMTSSPNSGSTPEVLDSWGMGIPTSQQAQTGSSSGTMGKEQENNFANLLERFLESVQSGNEDRTIFMSQVIDECNKVIATGSTSEDYKQFCQLLVEFLQYVTENQFLDDIRVMNIVSNVQDPVSQWTRSDQFDRSGILNPAIDILRDFKTMFE
jgi:hypothetical protein